jgi:hypothetical protein
MNKKDIQKSVWDRAFDNLDEEGNLIEKPNKIKSDRAVNIARASRIRSLNPEWQKNVAEANRKKHEDPVISAKIAAANKNRKERLGPEYSKKMSKAQHRRYDNMSEEERQQMSIRSKTTWENSEYVERMKAFYSSPEQIEKHKKQVREVAKRSDWKEKVKILNKEKRNNPEHIKRHQEAIDKRTQDPEWRKKQAQRSKPVLTPFGIFPKLKDACAKMVELELINKDLKTPLVSAGQVIRRNIKQDKLGWKFISQEEYITLTGKEI